MGPSDEKDVLQNAALLQVSSSVSGTGRAPSTARYFLTCLVVAATFTGLVLAFWAHGFHQVQESSLVSGDVTLDWGRGRGYKLFSAACQSRRCSCILPGAWTHLSPCPGNFLPCAASPKFFIFYMSTEADTFLARTVASTASGRSAPSCRCWWRF